MHRNRRHDSLPFILHRCRTWPRLPNHASHLRYRRARPVGRRRSGHHRSHPKVTRHTWPRPPTSAPTVLGIYVECKVQADVARVDSLAGKRVVHAGVAQAKCESHVPRGGRVEATLGYPTPRAAEVRAAGNHAASGEVDPGFLVRTG